MNTLSKLAIIANDEAECSTIISMLKACNVNHRVEGRIIIVETICHGDIEFNQLLDNIANRRITSV